MKILFTRFPLESALGGAEWQVISLMEGLRARGHSVEFLGSCPVLLKLCKERNISTETVQIGPPPVSKKTILRFFFEKERMRRTLIKKIAEHAPEKIVMLSLSEKILITEKDVPTHPAIFWIEHDKVGNWLTKNPWLSHLKRNSSFATTITVSKLSKRLYEGLKWPGNIVVLPNGIDPKRLEGAAEKSVPPLVGCIARLSPEKGVDVLLDAVTDVPEVNLTIVGKGREEGFLRTIIMERQLEDRVSIVSSVERLGSFYRSLSVLVLPSIENDPFGLVAAEAMLCGVPVIITDECGIADFLKHEEDALIVPAGSSILLKKAIDWIVRDPQRALIVAEKGHKTAERLFGLEKMIDRYEQVLLGNESE